MRFLAGVVFTFVALIAAGIAVIHSGSYNVAATRPHSELADWALSIAMVNSIRTHARDIRKRDLDDDGVWRKGLASFDAMCVTCHGGPGVDPSEIGKGLRPDPPDLAQVAAQWDPAELFWIVKHGIRMTGMPAFGPTHSDEEIWAIVAFLGRLPGMSAQRYRSLVETAELHGEDKGGTAHEHPRE